MNVLLHGAFWILLFLLPYLLQPSFEDNVPPAPRQPPPQEYAIFYLLKCFFWVVVFYFNTYVLVPRLMYRKKRGFYILALVALLVLLSLLEIAYFSMKGHGTSFRIRNFFLFNFFPFLFILASSTAYRMFNDKSNTEKKTKEMESEHLKSELSFLRSQISPHFMFNVLNNIVALARKRSDLVEPSLIKLSSLMRYFLYENKQDKVSLEKEIEYLQSYIDLQRQRFGKNMHVHVSVGEVDGPYEIEPMLLIPFVENAFKHGVVQHGSIDIELSAKDAVLHFSVVNAFLETPGGKDEVSGIGLANVHRRLKLLYGDKHVLLITKRDGVFRVVLELKLH